MRKTKIALPSNDGLNIFPGMLGRARQFYIYERGDNGKINFLEVRINPYAFTNQHLKTLDVYELLKDCPVIISARIGKRGVERLEQRGVKLFFRRGEIKEALKELLGKMAGNYRTLFTREEAKNVSIQSLSSPSGGREPVRRGNS